MKTIRELDRDPTLIVRSTMASLTKAEQKVAQLVLQDPEYMMFASVTDVSERVSVGETTVIRVCRKLGFRGYQEFKLAIAQHLSTPAQEVQGPIHASDTLDTAIQKIATYNLQTLQDTANLLSSTQVQEVAKLVREARHVYIIGVGSSGITALDLRYRLMRIGIHAVSENDAHLMAMLCSLATQEDVVIGISASGSTKDVIEALTIAKNNNVPIVCITNHARSPITHLAHVALLTVARESPLQGGAVGTKIAQMHVLDALTTAISLEDHDFAAKSMAKTAEAVVDKLM